MVQIIYIKLYGWNIELNKECSFKTKLKIYSNLKTLTDKIDFITSEFEPPSPSQNFEKASK